MQEEINDNIKINYSNLIPNSVLQRHVNLIRVLLFRHLRNVILKTRIETVCTGVLLDNLIICHFI